MIGLSHRRLEPIHMNCACKTCSEENVYICVGIVSATALHVLQTLSRNFFQHGAWCSLLHGIAISLTSFMFEDT